MKVLTFGEIMLRLKAPGMTRLLTDHYLEATFGGGEANVAVSLANYGMDVGFLTVLPDNPITDACVRELRGFGVDTSRIVTGDGRFGVYYVEGGANQLPSRVVYDRAWSAIAMAKPGDIDWDKAFEGVEWFHITGITPAISESAMELSLESVKEAKKREYHRFLRPQLPQESLEIRQEGQRGHARDGQVRRCGDRQRGRRTEVARDHGRCER